MYEQFFGLKKEPFKMTPDPAFLYFTDAHREALAALTYAVVGQKGFVVLTGDAGTGKTTLLTRLVELLPESRMKYGWIANPTLTSSEFLEMTLMAFGMDRPPLTKPQRLQKLQRLLCNCEEAGKVAVLIVDEAQQLAPDVLEEIRLLSNFERPEGKRLQIILAGQSELHDLLNRHEFRQIKQRIAVRLQIRSLWPSEVGQYISHRWSIAGGSEPTPFEPSAVTQIIECSKGIPRIVNAVCDNALMLAFGEGSYRVREQHILEIGRDLDFRGTELPRAQIAPISPLKIKRMVIPKRVIKPVSENEVGKSRNSLPSLERDAPALRRSWFGRWAGKLGSAS
jgi:general secretion pathway protein A